MAVQLVEDVDEVVIGKRYSVPVVIRRFAGCPKRFAVMPIIGPLHEDAEFVNFPDRHWHPDRRFVSAAWLKAKGAGHWAVVFTPFPCKTVGGSKPPAEPFVVDGGRRILTCKRLVASMVHPRFGAPPPWIQKLEKVFQHERLRERMICPHRGISCVGVAAESDGGVVCPGHGLKWNPKTGEMVHRKIYERLS